MSQTLKCALCGRTINDKNPLHVNGVGYVGASCYRKVNLIEERLAELNLSFLLTGQEFPMQPTTDGAFTYSPQALAEAQKCNALGVPVKVTVQKGENGPVNVLKLHSGAYDRILKVKAGAR